MLKFNMLCSALELLTFGSKDRVEGIMQESLLKRKFVMDMFQKIIDRNIKCCKLIFVFYNVFVLILLLILNVHQF